MDNYNTDDVEKQFMDAAVTPQGGKSRPRGNNYRSGSDKSHKYSIATKLTLSEHQAVQEFANHCTNANISAAVRELIYHGLNAVTQETKNLPASLKMVQMKIERERKAQHLETLQREYVALQHDYDPEYEKALKGFAKEKGLKYPPNVDQLNLWDIDQNLSRTLYAVRTTINGNGETTLREICRKNNCTADESLTYLKRLREFGQIAFDDVPAGHQCVVRLTQ